MSDGEAAEPTFESAGSGSSLTFPQQASLCRKNAFIMVKGHACKVIDMTISKTGKHGHAKCKFTCVDIFNGAKLEMLESSTHNVDVPNVVRNEFQMLDLDSDGFLTLMLDDGSTREDINISLAQSEMQEKIKEMHEKGDQLIVTILAAIGMDGNLREQPIDVKLDSN